MTKPIVWTIAGTDPSGGAGIQADLKTMNALGVHGCTVITALLAQNTHQVRLLEYPSNAMLEAQISALLEDLPPQTIKLGMLGNSETVGTVAKFLRNTKAQVVCDPVLRSSSGTNLLESNARRTMLEDIFPRTDLLTPNIPEAEAITGLSITSTEAMQEAAKAMLSLGPKAVLLKGGHLAGQFCQDYFTDGKRQFWLTSPRQNKANTHGTGCTLSAAIASSLALGDDLPDALVLAKAYVNQGIRLGDIQWALDHAGWPANPADLPWLTDSAAAAHRNISFPSLDQRPIGLYPLVDNLPWLEELLSNCLTTIQLRIKDTPRPEDIHHAVKLARQYNTRLFINDYWQLAIEAGAYGVHLGQSDLAAVDWPKLSSSGLRLGISTHSYAELARAAAYHPSYIAIGTIYPSPSKPGLLKTLGPKGFGRLARLSPAPVVAIGGMHPDNAAAILGEGASGIAVISDLRDAQDVAKRVQQWQETIYPHSPKRNI